MFLLAALLVGATGASSGPDLAEKAVVVDLPITDVAVFSDRARVTRSGPVRFTGGPQVVRAPDLPGVTMLDSLRVTGTGTRVIRVETRPVERERLSIDQVDAWIGELEVLGDKIGAAAGKLVAAQQELQLLAGLQAAPPIEEKERLGKPVQPAADAWRAAQDQLARRRSAARVVERDAERELRALSKQYEVAQREVMARDLGGYTDQKVEVLVIVDGPPSDSGGAGALAVEYGVPGAFWKPAYDLFFDPDSAEGGTVELKASGLITQATGEDWNGVKLALSTAIPGQGISMPTLRTWTLGDDREFVPVPSARTQPRTTRPFTPPAARPRIAELEQQADRALLTERSNQLITLANTPVEDFINGTTMLVGATMGDAGGSGGVSDFTVEGGGRGSVAKKSPIEFDDDAIQGVRCRRRRRRRPRHRCGSTPRWR